MRMLNLGLGLNALRNKIRKRTYGFSNNPVILLDIDGVISPMGSVEGLIRRARHVQFSNFAVTDDVAAFFSALSLVGDVDIVWASTWEEESAVLGEELEIKDSGYLEFNRADHTAHDTWFKERAVRQFLAENQHRRVVWLDDDMPPQSLEVFHQLHPRILIPHVDPMKGVDDEIMETVLSFLFSADEK